MKNELMIDIETTGTNPGCKVLTLGAFGFAKDGSQVEFYKRFSILAASTGQCDVTIRIDSQDGPVVGKVKITSTGSVDNYKEFSCKIKGAKGVQHLFFCFSNPQGDTHLDCWQFEK